MIGAGAGHPARPRETIVFSQPSDLENQAVRLFHAPIEHVFRVFTDPAYAPSIWAENPADVKIEEMDLRPGGRFSIRVAGPDGATDHFFGEYREVVPSTRVVNTFSVSDLPGVVTIETDEFESVGSDTRLTVRWRFESRSDRDKMYGPGLEAALTRAWEAVDRLLESMS